jgi:hypothetical protein
MTCVRGSIQLLAIVAFAGCAAPSLPPGSLPDGLQPTATATSLTLAWDDQSSGESGFKIERKTGTGGTFAEIDTVGANVETYTNTGLTPSTTYCYRVCAFSATAVSGYSNEACGTTLAMGAPTVGEHAEEFDDALKPL